MHQIVAQTQELYNKQSAFSIIVWCLNGLQFDAYLKTGMLVSILEISSSNGQMLVCMGAKQTSCVGMN